MAGWILLPPQWEQVKLDPWTLATHGSVSSITPAELQSMTRYVRLSLSSWLQIYEWSIQEAQRTPSRKKAKNNYTQTHYVQTTGNKRQRENVERRQRREINTLITEEKGKEWQWTFHQKSHKEEVNGVIYLKCWNKIIKPPIYNSVYTKIIIQNWRRNFQSAPT